MTVDSTGNCQVVFSPDCSFADSSMDFSTGRINLKVIMNRAGYSDMSVEMDVSGCIVYIAFYFIYCDDAYAVVFKERAAILTGKNFILVFIIIYSFSESNSGFFTVMSR